MLHRADGHARHEAALPRVLRAGGASPFDYPLSSRFDENDAVIIFDDAFIPWENVLVYRRRRAGHAFYRASGFMPRYTLQSATRLGVKLDFMCGLLAQGPRGQRHRRLPRRAGALGELIALAQHDLGDDTALMPRTAAGAGRQRHPALEYAVLVAPLRHAGVGRRRADSSAEHSAARPLVVPSSVERPASATELGPLIDRYYRGSTGDAARPDQALQADLGRDRQRVRRPPRALRDELQRQPRADPARHAALRGPARLIGAAHRDWSSDCMADYDLDGFTAAPWANA